MKPLRLVLLAVLLVSFLFPSALARESEVPVMSDNPLIDPDANRVTAYASLPDRMLTILLLGIDSATKDYTFRVEESHTDTMLLLAVNLDKGRADLVSIPRDTMAYVPGTRGVYKINCAINVGGTRAGKPARSDEGFQAVRETVEWFMGGIRIDHYIALDMEAMQEIGDEIGGIDFYVDMKYKGSSGRIYEIGLQHLDGKGIQDYFRARQNATVQTGSDLARTGRQRNLLTAIFKKLLMDQSLPLSLIQRMGENKVISNGLFTDIPVGDIPRLVQDAFSLMNAGNGSEAVPIGSHVIFGNHRNAFGNWRFTFTDMENRRTVISQVFGVDVPDLKYVSYAHAKWLYESGFRAIRYLTAADGILAFLQGKEASLLASEKAQAAAADFMDARTAVRDTFLAAAQTRSETDTRAMTKACGLLRSRGDALAKLISYPEKNGKVTWQAAKYHDDDRLVNTVYVNFR